MTPHSNGAARTAGTDGKAIRNKLTPEAWCARALEILSEEGVDGLKISRLAGDLGVTYGSFYHHFDSADAFYQAVLSSWQKMLVRTSHEHLKTPDPTITSLVTILRETRLPAYDIAIRQWARTYPPAALAVKKADAFRMRAARRILEKHGLDTETARTRGEMIILMHVGSLEHPDWKRRTEMFQQFVNMADELD